MDFKTPVKSRAIGLAIMLLLLMSALAGCERTGLLENVSTESRVSGLSSSRDMNQFPLHKTVCDPWTGGQPGGPSSPELGIRAQLAYRGAGQDRWYDSKDYLSKGLKSSQTLFFNDLFVPTRRFTQGFATQTSQIIKDDTGKALIEYFGLEFQTEIALTSEQDNTSYEFALLADDGVSMKVGSGDNEKVLISDEGDHNTKLACGAFSVPLSRNSALPVKISYYQGPREHIALTLLWRPTSKGTAKSDPLCGHAGNDLYFDSNDGSKPQQSYKDLLSRGWTPVGSANFHLPGTQVFNPCVDAEPVDISNFQVLEVSSFQADLSWNSSRPGTSQVLVKKISTGEEHVTDSDQILRTDHKLTLTGLEMDETYEIQAVSVADDGGKGLGPKIRIKTP